MSNNGMFDIDELRTRVKENGYPEGWADMAVILGEALTGLPLVAPNIDREQGVVHTGSGGCV